MKIYLLAQKDEAEKISSKLKKYGEVCLLNQGYKHISEYKEFFKDPSPKILGLSPDIIEWTLPQKELKKIKNLRGICTSSAWVMFLDLDYCKKNGIIVCNTAGANSQSVAEYAIWMMLSLAKKFPLQIKNSFKIILNKKMLQTEIVGKTMGVVGLGNVGSRIAKLGQGLGMKVIYWNRSKKKVSYKAVKLETLLTEADFVFNCLENCDETQGFFNQKRLNLMKRSAYFISVMGGMGWGVEDDRYLVQMVKRGRLAGYSVENEHKGKFPKTFVGNVFVPTANAFYTQEARERVLKAWVDSIIGIVKRKYVNRVV